MNVMGFHNRAWRLDDNGMMRDISSRKTSGANVYDDVISEDMLHATDAYPVHLFHDNVGVVHQGQLVPGQNIQVGWLPYTVGARTIDTSNGMEYAITIPATDTTQAVWAPSGSRHAVTGERNSTRGKRPVASAPSPTGGRTSSQSSARGGGRGSRPSNNDAIIAQEHANNRRRRESRPTEVIPSAPVYGGPPPYYGQPQQYAPPQYVVPQYAPVPYYGQPSYGPPPPQYSQPGYGASPYDSGYGGYAGYNPYAAPQVDPNAVLAAQIENAVREGMIAGQQASAPQQQPQGNYELLVNGDPFGFDDFGGGGFGGDLSGAFGGYYDDPRG